MKKRSRLGLLIIINVLVSAATILVVLLIWEWTHPQPDFMPLSDGISGISSGDLNSETSLASQSPFIELVEENYQMTIKTVVGAGNLEMEHIEILNQSAGPVDLTGWKIVDEDGHQFSFPTMILDMNGALTIHSKSGQDTVIELYWQAETPIWQSGENVQLLDANGDLAASYSIP